VSARSVFAVRHDRDIGRLSAQLFVLVVGAAAIVFIFAVDLVLTRAAEQRGAIGQEASAVARAATHSLHGNAESAHALLLGLAAMRSLREGRFDEFRGEALAARLPAPSTLLLVDSDGSVAFGMTSEGAAADPQTIGVVRRAVSPQSSWLPSALMEGVVLPAGAGFSVVAAVPVGRDGAGGILALALPPKTLSALFAHHPPSPRWTVGLVDASGATIASSDAGEDFGIFPQSPPQHARAPGALALTDTRVTVEGLTVFARYDGSPWSAVVRVPAAVFAAPMWDAALLIFISGVVILALVSAIALVGAPRIAAPFEKSLAAGNERFRAMAETVPAILFTVAADGRCSYMSRRFSDLTDMPADVALEHGWVAAVHPDDRQRLLGRFGDQTPEASMLLAEFRLRGGDGIYRWFLGRLHPVSNPDEGSYWFCAAVDVDHLKRNEVALRTANAQLAGVLAGIDECYCTIDREGVVTSVNDAIIAWVGTAVGDLVGRRLGTAIPDLADPGFERRRSAAGKGRTPFEIELESSVRRGRWLEVHGYPWADGQSVFFRDISRRKVAEIASDRARMLLQGIIDALSAEIVLVDEAGIVIAANAAHRRVARDLPGIHRSDPIGSHYLAVCAAIVGSTNFAAIGRGLRAVVDGRKPDFRIHYRGRSADADRWFQMRATRFAGDIPCVVIAREDVTEIARARGQLQQLAGRILRVQDDERRRIARDIHDTTVQHLVAALMNVDLARRASLRGTQFGANDLEEASALVERSIQELRTLSYLLHPPLLEELGLVSALKWFVQGVEKRSGIQVAFEVVGNPDRAPPDVEGVLFRVVQEALTNVLRHSGSSTALVRLRQGSDEMVVEVVDRGRGFVLPSLEAAEGTAALGVGISGMRMRLHHLDGELEIRSSDAGTRVRARVPLGSARRASPRSEDGAPARSAGDAPSRQIA